MAWLENALCIYLFNDRKCYEPNLRLRIQQSRKSNQWCGKDTISVSCKVRINPVTSYYKVYNRRYRNLPRIDSLSGMLRLAGTGHERPQQELKRSEQLLASTSRELEELKRDCSNQDASSFSLSFPLSYS